MAGYQDAFYVEGNIIGYTGNINNNPTVYFRNGDTFGRITQDHPHQDNIGRNVTRTYADYNITNNHDGVAEEYYNGRVQHTSRNAFVPVDGANIAQLANAIGAFTQQKPKYQ